MQLESYLAWGMSVVFLISLILIYLKKADHEEPNIGWKLIGYFFLGTFTFRIESLVLPVGIAIFLLFFLPKLIVNKDAKKWAVSLGVLSFISSIIVSHSVAAFYEEVLHVKAGTNVYEMNFYNEYEKVKKALHAEGELAINNLEINFNSDGEVWQFNYETSYYRDGRDMNAWITMHDGNYQISTHVMDEELEMVNRENFISSPSIYFKALDLHGLKNMVPKGDSYYVSFTNSDAIQPDKNSSLWNIERAGITEKTAVAVTAEDNTETEEETEFEAYHISINTMNAMGAGAYQSDQVRYFIISPELFN
ncbi:hypothetical protein [Fictibacillus phosphorivorans]|uniref:hypothetical protein n=1 Tax=Fictibacillus phosphorivorans TaxID=1221500 RepID=UPI001293B8A5|nr:hypothetical protein [Fictibacillus phosphorivorans]MQR97384.1 hypothetical protein [Fictibacillus phosphorivorans]